MNPRARQTDEGSTRFGDGSMMSVSLVKWIIGGLVSGALVLAGAIWWAAVMQTNVGHAVEKLSDQGSDIRAIRDSMDTLAGAVAVLQRNVDEQWKMSTTVWWTAEFHRLNPSIPLPDLDAMPAVLKGNGGRDR